MTGRFARREGVPFLYAGRQEKESFLRRLLETGKDSLPVASLLEFALHGDPLLSWPLGANRNAYLLATAGSWR